LFYAKKTSKQVLKKGGRENLGKKKATQDIGVSPSAAGGISQKKKSARGFTGRYASSWWNWMATSGGVSVEVWIGPEI
jgi:hypothetical protein